MEFTDIKHAEEVLASEKEKAKAEREPGKRGPIPLSDLAKEAKSFIKENLKGDQAEGTVDDGELPDSKAESKEADPGPTQAKVDTQHNSDASEDPADKFVTEFTKRATEEASIENRIDQLAQQIQEAKNLEKAGHNGIGRPKKSEWRKNLEKEKKDLEKEADKVKQNRSEAEQKAIDAITATSILDMTGRALTPLVNLARKKMDKEPVSEVFSRADKEIMLPPAIETLKMHGAEIRPDVLLLIMTIGIVSSKIVE